ncbi:SusD/RagB family nutrient-binding outer membrane lipoprotein [Hymenobacter sp. BT770]|uniref:SusD/RagB family nutrient-binding outer membrane lipoprotein n=1 Tax=Hymenobacter sp. BT770 TaxID=2886942 RepID=UPI001D11AED4|nr:SusD/RagB family nutrient-binding outer membrane lipoprotein [Hymenobacter sp. BT770]MCC3152623.1 SusD/RagB family nutrient-binding outer membrane lipoprotein [Hymenobacter sp. BT770]MDO3414696.1 SusD/RagB family nutrient-binding outer membrane lipoprotein [Hymenobacter sp. BT770]
MKISFKMLAVAVFALAATSCKDALDINTNPNELTEAAITPDAIMAQAMTITAANYSGGPGVAGGTNFNSYASWAANYWGKTGVVSGYGEELTYNYSTSYYASLFGQVYDNLNDYNIIERNGKAQGYPNHAAIARIMKVYNFQLLVDEYGDIPYFGALQGSANLTPKYDPAADIYKDFLVQLDGAIADINTAAANPATRTVGPEDIVFAGNMTRWKQFANSLKLRVLLRQVDGATAAYAKGELPKLFASASVKADGFIDRDVVANPGYAQSSSQQNPFYTRYGFTAAGTNATERNYQIPTQFVLNQYRYNNDPRISQLYLIGARGPAVSATQPVPPTPEWIGAVPGESISPSFNPPVVGSRFLTGGGLLKGPNAPTPLMLLAEHLFSKAEVEARADLGLVNDANAKQDFLDGIKASFMYFYRPATGATQTLASATTSTAGIAQYTAYIAANVANGLVDYDAPTTTVPLMTDRTNALSNTLPAVAPRTVSKQEKILYQKYFALNTVASTEAWDDYRRTGLPKIPASSQSASPRADKLPTRLLYPLAELATNSGNLPKGVDQYTKIFWDVLD